MKKVRYAMGALGAVPAIAFMAPTANAATSASHAGKVGKSVSLIDAKKTPYLTCVGSKIATAHSDGFKVSVSYKGSGCIDFVYGFLDYSANLTMRIRLYSLNGTRDHQYFQANHSINGAGSTVWIKGPLNVHDHQACEALVVNGTSNSVVYGPICETL